MSIILMATLFYKALILQGEIWCSSLLGLKGLRVKVKYTCALPMVTYFRQFPYNNATIQNNLPLSCQEIKKATEVLGFCEALENRNIFVLVSNFYAR